MCDTLKSSHTVRCILMRCYRPLYDAISVSRHMKIGTTSSSAANSGLHSPVTQGPTKYDLSRTVDATAKHFTNRAQYSGILTESPSLSEMRSNYIMYCRDKNMSQTERVRLFHYALKGPAWTYWSERIQYGTSLTTLGAVFNKLVQKI